MWNDLSQSMGVQYTARRPTLRVQMSLPCDNRAPFPHEPPAPSRVGTTRARASAREVMEVCPMRATLSHLSLERGTGIAVVVALHAALIYALAVGLGVMHLPTFVEPMKAVII